MTDTAPAGLINDAVVGVDYTMPGDKADTAAPAAAGFDPGDHTVDEVNAYIADHPDEADAVYAAETAGRNRVGIVG